MADPVAYRQMLDAAFLQLRQRIARTARQFRHPDAEVQRITAADMARYAQELQRFVATLAQTPEPAEPILSAELLDTYDVGCKAVARLLAERRAPDACQLASRLLDLMQTELGWMPRP